MNILIAPDKFKGSLTARAVCTAITNGLQKNYPSADIQSTPLADGGDGTLEALDQYLSLKPRTIETVDPLGRQLEATYLEDDTTAFIEIASASGLVLLSDTERNPMLTSTYGTGLQLKDALIRGKKQIFLLLGGSATNDLGLGIAAALGFRFYNATDQQITPNGGQLTAIQRIDIPDDGLWKNAAITLLCDVDNPLYGPNGAAHVYAAQKGATATMINQLEDGAKQLAKLFNDLTHQSVDTLKGGGAAGGIGAGLSALIGGKLTSGFELIKQLSKLEEKIRWADIVISGEGQIDVQSLQGKVVGGVLDLCQKYNKRCLLFAGKNQLKRWPDSHEQSIETHEIMSIAPSTAAAMNEAAGYLEQLATTISLDIK